MDSELARMRRVFTLYLWAMLIFFDDFSFSCIQLKNKLKSYFRSAIFASIMSRFLFFYPNSFSRQTVRGHLEAAENYMVNVLESH